MSLNKNIFREYDIRGIYKEELDEDTAYLIGCAYGTKLKSYGKNKTVVAHDNRLSSSALSTSLINGILSSGVDVIDIGLATTPMCYFAANYYKVNASVMITASHNPKDYNGFKMSYNGIHNAFGDSISEIWNIISSHNFAIGKGKVIEKDVALLYIDLIIKKLNFGERHIKVVYDCGNGTTSIIANRIFKKLKNVDCIPLFDLSDGNFPNHHPDPTIEKNLQVLKQKVLETEADLGIGFDGDGDRVGFIDNLGNIIDADKFMIIMWRHLYDKVENKTCLFDVKCSKSLEDELCKLNIKPIEYRTGNSYVRLATEKYNCALSGELSGHFYFRDKFSGYDDGIYAGIRLIELLSHVNEPLSELLNGINTYYSTPEIKISVSDKLKFQVIENIKKYCLSKQYDILTIDGVKVKFNDGFALVRASNTGPNITMRFEAYTEKRLKEIQSEFTKVLSEYLDFQLL